MKIIRQGDCMFLPVAEAPSERKPRESGVILEGEVTNHFHRIADLESAEVFDSGWRGDVFVQVGERGVSVVHEEHHPVNLEPNTTYKVHRAREYDYLAEATRNVAD